MTEKVQAVPLVPHRCWVLKRNNTPVGLLNLDDDQYVVNSGGVITHYDTSDEVKNALDLIFQDAITEAETYDKEIYGYPVKFDIFFNPVFDVRRRLPLFTKKKEQDNWRCAGYYILKYPNMGWQHAYCPKLSTLDTYAFRGPFKTNTEMKEVLRNAKKESKNEQN